MKVFHKTSKKAFLFTTLFSFIFLYAPVLLLAQTEYVPLAPIETTLNSAGSTNLSTYLTGMFKVGVAAAGVLAFLMIVWGGFTYLSTDAITGKEEGKEYIQRALGGLLLAFVSYIILNTINPSLVTLDLYFGQKLIPKQQLGAPVDLIYYGDMTDPEKDALRSQLRGDISRGLNDKIQELEVKKAAGTATPADLQEIKKLEVVRHGTVAINKMSLAEARALEAVKKFGLLTTLDRAAQNAQVILDQMKVDAFREMNSMQEKGAAPAQIAVVQSRYNLIEKKINGCIQYLKAGRIGEPHGDCKR